MIIERNTSTNLEAPSPKTTTTFLRINGIAGVHYTSELSNSKDLIIFGLGAPTPPDNGNLLNAPHILKHGYDIFVPDYIGSGRSDGTFTPINCIKTFTKLFEDFTNGCEGTNTYEKIKKQMKYERVVIAGRSFAGTYVPLAPRFNSEITQLAIFYPVVDSKSQGTMEEETNELFLRGFKEDGYHHLYRGVLKPEWVTHLENQDDLSPMDNILYLTRVNMFIGHGKKDKIVSWKKSQIYYDLLLKHFPSKDKDFLFAIYSEGTHGSSTAIPATIDLVDWLANI